MIKNIGFGIIIGISNIGFGIIIGISNIVPGLSGGTLMVLLGIFDKITTSISNVFSIKNGIIKGKKKDIIFLIELILGMIIGIITFTKVLEFLFSNYFIFTISFFIGLIIFAIPSLAKNELKKESINRIPLMLGMIFILGLGILNPESKEIIITNFPTITLITLISSLFFGTIAGITTIFPGISGSMVLLILGQYYLYKSYIANVLPINFTVLIPLALFALGCLIGIVIGSKSAKYLLTKYKRNTLSFIMGLILGSAFVLIPSTGYTSIRMVILSVLFLILGCLTNNLLDKIKN